MPSIIKVVCPSCGEIIEVDLGLYGMSCKVQEDLTEKVVCKDVSTIVIGAPTNAVKDCPNIKSIDNLKTSID